MAQHGVSVDLKEKGMTVEQALRKLKQIMEADIEQVKMNEHFIPPSKRRREKAKEKKRNIRRYEKYNR